jgi:hypothetical protein
LFNGKLVVSFMAAGKIADFDERRILKYIRWPGQVKMNPSPGGGRKAMAPGGGPDYCINLKSGGGKEVQRLFS